MKRLVLTIVGVLIFISLLAIGCAEKEPVSPLPKEGQEIVSTCVTCHTDKGILQEVATTEEEAKSEVTSGEG